MLILFDGFRQNLIRAEPGLMVINLAGHDPFVGLRLRQKIGQPVSYRLFLSDNRESQHFAHMSFLLVGPDGVHTFG